MKMITFLKYFLACVAALCALIALGGWAFYKWHPVFGGQPDEISLTKMRASKAFNGETFDNLEPTPLMTSNEPPSIWRSAMRFLNPVEGKNPIQPLPTVPLNTAQLKNGSVVWFGHSTVLFQTDGKLFITDPVFHAASPLPMGGKPFAMTHAHTVAELPPIDGVLISHDHYDHLDYQAIQEIDAKTAHFYVPLGVKAHLQRWGVAEHKITEMDWNEQARLGNVAITLVPSRHFSGRTFDRNTTLWGGYVVKSPDVSLYFSADSGYGKHFADIIAKHAPFDLAMMENGAYNTKWALIHSTPEQAAQAMHDIGAQKVLPIHWGKFDLSEHAWKDPIERFTRAAEEKSLEVATPKIGEVFQIENLPKEKWWESVQ